MLANCGLIWGCMTISDYLNLDRFARYTLLDGPTLLQPLERLNRQLGGVRVFVKRDDLTGIGLGGNKLRKLEYLLGEALAQEADVFITVGARQSNHARLAAAAAAHAGIRCELVLTRTVPRYDVDYTDNGNVLLDGLFGAVVHDLPSGADALAFALERADVLRKQGFVCYVAPSGGSSAVGCLGYARCAVEIAMQSEAAGLIFSNIVVANGSGGTHAGLVAGQVAMGKPAGVIKSYTVLEEQGAAQSNTLAKAQQTAALLDPALQLTAADIGIDGQHRGEGYGIPTAGMLEALRLLAGTEGLLLDPVYSGKAFAGMLADIGAGVYKRGEDVLFILTGGTPGLFAYRSDLSVRS